MQTPVRILAVGILKILLVLKLQVLVHQFSRHFHREPKVDAIVIEDLFGNRERYLWTEIVHQIDRVSGDSCGNRLETYRICQIDIN
jgi:hypothetical protein